MTDLWQLDSYRALVDRLTNRSIIEYDMKSANISLAKEFKLLPEKEINRIEKLGKKERVIAVGKIKQQDKTYNEKEKEAFKEARRLFFDLNNIQMDDVIAIKRDAIFLTRYVGTEKCSEFINFRKKNEYTSYLYLKPFEIFFHPDNGLDIKGMSTDIYENYHKEYMGDILHGLIRTLEVDTIVSARKFLTRMIDRYKWMELDIEYYREFTPMSLYRYRDGHTAMEEFMGDKTELDITHNFKLLTDLLLTLV